MPPMHRQTFGIIFSTFQYKKNDKHAQDCPLVAGRVVAPQTLEHWGSEKKNKTDAGLNKPASGKPVHLYTDPYHCRKETEIHGTDLLPVLAAKAINSCFCSFPVSPALGSTCIRQHLLSSLNVVPQPQFSPKNTTKYPLTQEPLHQAKAINTHKKGKGKPLNTFSINRDHNVMI